MDDCEYTELTCDDIARLGMEAIIAASLIVADDGSVYERQVPCDA